MNDLVSKSFSKALVQGSVSLQPSEEQRAMGRIDQQLRVWTGHPLNDQRSSHKDSGLRFVTALHWRPATVSPHFRSIEMTTLKQRDRQFKYLSLSVIECKLLATLRHGTGGAEPLLIITVSESFPLNDHPSPTAGACHARAQNAIRHSGIIR